MKPLHAALGAAAVIVFGGVIVCVAQPGTDRPQLRPPETFAHIADQKERSLALFQGHHSSPLFELPSRR